MGPYQQISCRKALIRNDKRQSARLSNDQGRKAGKSMVCRFLELVGDDNLGVSFLAVASALDVATGQLVGGR